MEFKTDKERIAFITKILTAEYCLSPETLYEHNLVEEAYWLAINLDVDNLLGWVLTLAPRSDLDYFVTNMPELVAINTEIVSLRPDITYKYMKENDHIAWNFSSVSGSCPLKVMFEMEKDGTLDIFSTSFRSDLTIEYIIKNYEELSMSNVSLHCSHDVFKQLITEEIMNDKYIFDRDDITDEDCKMIKNNEDKYKTDDDYNY